MTQIRNLPLGIQTFEDIRNRNFVYVDKSRYVYELASFGKPYFLSRPRSFGKSLFLSTLRAYFEGQKEMFKGLDLEQLEPQLAKTQNREEWIKHPVLYLDFNVGSYTTLEEFKESLNTKLSVWEKEYGITQELVGKKSHAYWLNSELPIPMLYQTGYLTIKGYETDIQSFTLGFPDNEVRYGFFKCLVPYYAGFENGSDRIEIVNFIKEIRNGQTEKFMKRIQCIFSSAPQKQAKNITNSMHKRFSGLFLNLSGNLSSAKYKTEMADVMSLYGQKKLFMFLSSNWMVLHNKQLSKLSLRTMQYRTRISTKKKSLLERIFQARQKILLIG